MYIAILLHNGQRERLGSYDSVRDFRYDYPEGDYPQYFVKVMGRMIYVTIIDV